MEEPVFGKEYIENEFQRISKKLSRQIEVFLIGGGAMSFHNLKDATKDIDIVVKNEKDFQKLQETLLDLDYRVVRNPNQEYEELGAQTILENTDNCRFDIFNQQVVNKLFFSKSMQKRCQDLIETRKLKVKTASHEDIFLFKTVGGRTTDIEDINTLIQTNLNFETVKKEIQI